MMSGFARATHSGILPRQAIRPRPSCSCIHPIPVGDCCLLMIRWRAGKCCALSSRHPSKLYRREQSQRRTASYDMSVTTAQSRRTLRRRGLIADVVLAGVALGPLAAPLLYSSGSVGPEVAGIIYTMGSFVCPQPGRAVALYDGQLMAVCMRCYGTVLGLLATRLLMLPIRARAESRLPSIAWRRCRSSLRCSSAMPPNTPARSRGYGASTTAW